MDKGKDFETEFIQKNLKIKFPYINTFIKIGFGELVNLLKKYRKEIEQRKNNK